MRKVYTWAAVPAERNLTVADLRAGKNKRKFTQVTANTEEEAHAAGVAGLDMIICNAANVQAVRAGNNQLFLTAALGLPDYPAEIDIMRGAHKALAAGADAVMTARSMKVVAMLAMEDMPVMGHLGLVPRKSTWIGGLRAFGKTSDEAYELYQRFRRLEDAGAFAVEAEVIPGPVMGLISRRSGLITVSLGSGAEADVMYPVHDGHLRRNAVSAAPCQSLLRSVRNASGNQGRTHPRTEGVSQGIDGRQVSVGRTDGNHYSGGV